MTTPTIEQARSELCGIGGNATIKLALDAWEASVREVEQLRAACFEARTAAGVFKLSADVAKKRAVQLTEALAEEKRAADQLKRELEAALTRPSGDTP